MNNISLFLKLLSNNIIIRQIKRFKKIIVTHTKKKVNIKQTRI